MQVHAPQVAGVADAAVVAGHGREVAGVPACPERPHATGVEPTSQVPLRNLPRERGAWSPPAVGHGAKGGEMHRCVAENARFGAEAGQRLTDRRRRQLGGPLRAQPALGAHRPMRSHLHLVDRACAAVRRCATWRARRACRLRRCHGCSPASTASGPRPGRASRWRPASSATASTRSPCPRRGRWRRDRARHGRRSRPGTRPAFRPGHRRRDDRGGGARLVTQRAPRAPGRRRCGTCIRRGPPLCRRPRRQRPDPRRRPVAGSV